MKTTINNVNFGNYFNNFLAYLYGGTSTSIETELSSFNDDYYMLKNDLNALANDFNNAKIKLGLK